ncbi:hypothetical protein PDESU_05868 [Pontiella desulfatans]|uniref:Uncharacterized protein n=1 Tax=Pontiella desulfatans TaxID=2750659 RepID=A0A6C2UAV5_PONDE|nr:hypothetical protein [Pontiella desulfatans]VGO17272.1 hypothetical protein PDESU_05868 [Pontiella desulfatans]
MHRWIVFSLLLCDLAWASPVEAPSKNWQDLREKNLRMGFTEERVGRAIAACRSAGLKVAEAEDLFCPVYAAHDEELPSDCIFLKIEEGLAKHVAWKEVHGAADRRLACMRQADQLIMAARNHRGGQHAHLVMHTCMALESGLPADALEQTFSRPGRFRYGRLIHVVEAGEALKLAGFANPQIVHIMNDCLDRDLSGAEVFRVVDLLQAGLREGKDFETIHATLWASADK